MFTLFQIFGHLAFIKKQITELMLLFSYLFLDKGQVAENLKQSTHSVLMFSLWSIKW